MHVPCFNTCRSKTSEKPFTFYIENAKLRAVGAVAVFSYGKNCQKSVFAGRLKTLNKL